MSGAARRIITLLTDFGSGDPFVGVMKGVILGINPDAVVVDLCHGGAPYDPAAAAFLLLASYRYFPEGTIHVAVVDPGVGGPRRPLLATCDGHLFVGPDNGVFTPIGEQRPAFSVRAITESRYFLTPVSATFHGRDVFAPVAAHLSLGTEPSAFGSPVETYVRLMLPRPSRVRDEALRGQILHVERFGNLVTNIARTDLDDLAAGHPLAGFAVEVAGRTMPVVGYYGQVAPGAVGAVIGSTDHLEIFINQGDASRLFGIGRGTEVVVTRATPSR
jgi:S-adenosylmethionine hydrolase